MKTSLLLGIVCLAATATAPAASVLAPLIDALRPPGEGTPRALALDPKRIINQSNSFLKEREPEMNAEDYAIYVKVVDMIGTNPDLAVRMLEAMMTEKEPPSPAFAFILGNAYYGANRLDLAEKYYRSAVDRFPTFIRGWDNLGILYYTSQRFGDAATCLAKAIALGDHDPVTFGLLGYCLERQGDVVASEMAYLQALGGDPGNTDWREGLSRIYMAGRQYGRAESLVRNLIREQPAEKRFWLALASVLIAEDKKVEATVLLETAAGAGVAGTDELLLLGDLYTEQHLAAEAVATYQKVLATAPDRGEAKLIQYARALIAVGELPEAERALAAIKDRVTPEGRPAYLQARADLLLAGKRWPEARAEAEALLKLAPLDGPALLTVGRTYLEEHDFPRAAFAYEAAYRIPETTYRASLELARIELHNRRYARCVEYLEKALSLQKSDAVADYLTRVKLLMAQDSPPPG